MISPIKTTLAMFVFIILFFLTSFVSGIGNQTLERNQWAWSDPVVITAVASSVSGFAALVTAILLFLNFKKQIKLFNLQINEMEQVSRFRKTQHYQLIRDRIKSIRDSNVISISNAENVDFTNFSGLGWSSLRIVWFMVEEINKPENIDLKYHIIGQIPDLKNRLEKITQSIDNYHKSITKLKFQLIKEVQKTFLPMIATQSADRPEIMEFLETYWFEEILSKNLKGEKLDKILKQIEPINKKSHHQVYNSGSELWANERQMCTGEPIHRDLFDINSFGERFTKKVMDLVTDNSIIKRLQTLIQERKKIGEEISKLNESLNQIINYITYNRYHEIFDCCK